MKKKLFLSLERTWVLVFALCVILLTSIPYLIAASQQEGAFTGFLIGVEDGNSYIAKMLRGAQGDWLFRSPYTTTDQEGVLIYLPYLLLGKLLGPNAQHGALVLLFHIFRSLTIILLCFATYDFMAFFIRDEWLRRLGLILTTLGSGLGWLLLFIGVPLRFDILPLDFYSPEAFGYLAIFSLPHIVISRAILLWGFLAYLKSGLQDKSRNPNTLFHQWWITLLWLALTLIHLITAVLGLFLIACHFGFVVFKNSLQKRHLVVKKDQLFSVGWAMVGSLPVFAYNAWIFVKDAYLHSWAAQNQILSPNFLIYFLAWGLMLPFAYFGLRRLWQAQWRSASFFTVWLVLLPLLLYAPVNLQRRLSEGAWVMLVLLAMAAFETNRKQSGSRNTQIKPRTSRELWLFSLAFPSTLILFLGSLQAAQRAELPIFIPRDEERVFNQLRQMTNDEDIVLTTYATGNALPAWIPVRVVVGHGLETDHAQALLPKVQAVYRGRTPEDTRLEFLQKYKVTYIFWGPAERTLGSWDPTTVPYLDLIVESRDYQIFQVSPEAIN